MNKYIKSFALKSIDIALLILNSLKEKVSTESNTDDTYVKKPKDKLDKSTLTWDTNTGFGNVPGVASSEPIASKIGKCYRISNDDFEWQLVNVVVEEGTTFVYLTTINEPVTSMKFPVDHFRIFFKESTFKLDEIIQ